MYSLHVPEEIIRNVLDDYDRDEQVVATTGYFPINQFSGEEEPLLNAPVLSRKTIEQELENSLDSLGMGTIDPIRSTGVEELAEQQGVKMA